MHKFLRYSTFFFITIFWLSEKVIFAQSLRCDSI
nr:MAG TPA: hypothetical protein [Caudoviricetes sp.]DAY99604.1 MAG TPA: hypothetical protein [Caudoviricetes sp.]